MNRIALRRRVGIEILQNLKGKNEPHSPDVASPKININFIPESRWPIGGQAELMTDFLEKIEET